MAKMAEMGAIEEIKRANAVDTLGSQLSDFSDDPSVLLHTVRALQKIADADADLSVKIARQLGGKIMVTRVNGLLSVMFVCLFGYPLVKCVHVDDDEYDR